MKTTLPKIIYGSSALGNLYEVVPEETKHAIVRNWIHHQASPVIDSAGKYGAGLALENIGRLLSELGVAPDTVRISNKLGWKRIPLTTSEPTFEQGAWFGLEHDAEQCISYEGILECYEQGNALLGEYRAELLSVHDPDEYLAAAESESDAARRYEDILGAYQALAELRDRGDATGIGIGSKDWHIIQRLYRDGVAFDWVMFANSYTLYRHPPDVMEFMSELQRADITVINSAVFNAGFLIGGKYFDYVIMNEQKSPELFAWRRDFLDTCKAHGISPAHACCQFGLSHPAVASLALNTSKPGHIATNVSMVHESIDPAFWNALKDGGLLPKDYPYL